MTATACTERFSRIRRGAAEASRLCVCLGASLLLHGALLRLSVAELRDQHAGTAPLPAVTLTLMPLALRATASAATPSPAAVAPLVAHGDVLRDRPLPRSVTAAPVASSESDAMSVASERRLDLDKLRAQARDLAHAPAEQLIRGGERPSAPPAAVPDLLDRPLLDALSRRIGKPLRVASEQRLADGSRMVRFVGNVCLHVPQHLPLGRENAFTPTVLVPTNCND